MKVLHDFIEFDTGDGFSIQNITEQVAGHVRQSGVRNGVVAITSQHTTTAITVNECEQRLLEDIKTYFGKLVPADVHYLHNDIHLRDCPPDEPENAHSHLMAMLFGNSESIAINDGELVLGQWQSIMLLELDGPRKRKVSVQVVGNMV